MQPRSAAYLEDIKSESERLSRFISGRSFEDYLSDELLFAAVARQFVIIGEALSALARLDPETASAITDYRRIIGFRNVLVHRYAQVDASIVWNAAETRLALLHAEASALLDSDEHA